MTILAIDNSGRLDLLQSTGNGLAAASLEGGLVIPAEFDPVEGTAAMAVVFPRSGMLRTYRFSSTGDGGALLVSTKISTTLPVDGSLGTAEVALAKCVELSLPPTIGTAIRR